MDKRSVFSIPQVSLARWLGLLWVVFSLPAFSVTVDDLLNSDQLKVDVRVSDDGLVSVKQPITLRIEVATDRWFSKGSRVGAFSMRDVVIPPVSELAINGNRKINGETWVTQVREILLYPVKAGSYQVPSLAVSVSVNSAQGIVEGKVMTKPVGFEVQLPEELRGIEDFIVSPDVSLEIEGDFDPDKLYRVGDAVTQVITMTAADTPAMMLPELSLAQLPGVSVYRKPSEVLNQSSRGDLQGVRIETRVYIFEEKGEYLLPEQAHYWWDSDDQVLKSLVVPEQKWIVERKAFSWKSLATDFNWADYAKAFVSFLIGVALLWQLFRRRKVLIGLFLIYSRHRERKIKNDYMHSLQQQDYKSSCQWLYSFYNLPSGDSDTLRAVFSGDEERLAILERLFLAAFSCEDSGLSSDRPSLSEAKLLLNRPAAPKNTKELLVSAEIQLN